MQACACRRCGKQIRFLCDKRLDSQWGANTENIFTGATVNAKKEDDEISAEKFVKFYLNFCEKDDSDRKKERRGLIVMMRKFVKYYEYKVLKMTMIDKLKEKTSNVKRVASKKLDRFFESGKTKTGQDPLWGFFDEIDGSEKDSKLLAAAKSDPLDAYDVYEKCKNILHWYDKVKGEAKRNRSDLQHVANDFWTAVEEYPWDMERFPVDAIEMAQFSVM